MKSGIVISAEAQLSVKIWLKGHTCITKENMEVVGRMKVGIHAVMFVGI
jgi:hypothetical protein